MSYLDNIVFSAECQGFIIGNPNYNSEKCSFTFSSHSHRPTADMNCPHCGSKHIHQNKIYARTVKGIPLHPGCSTLIKTSVRSFECQECKKVFSENVPFLYPGTRITKDLAAWIKEMLTFCSISAISRLFDVNWETVKGIHKGLATSTLKERRARQLREHYRPRFLGVYEFAIHKGHTYATVVMDIETGEVLWVGKDRTIEAFDKFFEEIEMELLEDVEAVAMDMNASYDKAFSQRMPGVKIVYDRYHMEANYGKDVMGVVRLDAAREYKKQAGDETLSQKQRGDLKRQYTKMKKARWMLLAKGLGVRNEDGPWTCCNNILQEILDKHHDISLCYAMKQELGDLYSVSDPQEAETRWNAWFDAAEASGIPALERFSRNKRIRLPGLIAHSMFPISTSKVEGTNNKIKVLKRIAYGFKDDDYFFSLIRYSTIPKSTCHP